MSMARRSLIACGIIAFFLAAQSSAAPRPLDEPAASWEKNPENQDALVLVWHPDGKRLFSEGRGVREIRIWNVADQQLLRKLEIKQGGINSRMAVSHDGSTLARFVSQPRSVVRWDVESGKMHPPIAFPGLADYVPVAYSPDDGTLVVGGGPAWAYTFKNNTGRFLVPDETKPDFTPRARGRQISYLGFSADGSVFVEHGWPVTRVWDWQAGKIKFEIRHRDTPSPGAVSPDGTRWVYVDSERKVVSYDIAQKKLRQVAQTKPQPLCRGLVMSPLGTHVFTVDNDCGVKVWDVETLKLVRTIRAFKRAGTMPMAISPDGKTLATGDDTIRLWDVSELAVVTSPSDPKTEEKEAGPPAKGSTK